MTVARIRSIKPEIRSSEKVTSWPIPLRYFWVLLWGFCDDHGRGRDNARLIKADAFPLDDEITADQVDDWMHSLAAAGVIHRYELAEARYFRIVNWSEHQKVQHPSKSVIPCPHGIVVQGSCESHEGLTSVSGDSPPRAGSGERGAVEQGDASGDAEPPEFCPEHPKGTSSKCGPCGDARRRHMAWERARRDNVPRVPRQSELASKFCSVEGHGEYPLEGPEGRCAKCAREREEVLDERAAS